jgi:DnaB-like helicase N terminal domain
MRSTIEAEQALLGAILCDPVGQRHVLDLVEPGDMYRPWHAQVLAAMHRLRGRGVLPSAADVYRELQADPDLPRSIALDAVPLARLMEAAPRPEHSGAYAAIVVEAEIRRRLQLTGSHLLQAAESGELEAALAQVTHARADLAACAARWSALPCSKRTEPDRRPGRSREEHRSRPTTRPITGVSGNGLFIHNTAVDARPAPAAGQAKRSATKPDVCVDGKAAGCLASTARRRDGLAEAASAAALRDLIDDPSQLEAVAGWLRPGHFANAVHGQIYALLEDMRAVGKAIDAVTITCEAARRGVRTDPSRLSGGVGSFAVADAREVHRNGTLTQVTRAGISIQADAAEPARALGPLLRTAAERLESLGSELQPGIERAPPASSARKLCRAPAKAGGQPEPEAAP